MPLSRQLQRVRGPVCAFYASKAPACTVRSTKASQNRQATRSAFWVAMTSTLFDRHSKRPRWRCSTRPFLMPISSTCSKTIRSTWSDTGNPDSPVRASSLSAGCPRTRRSSCVASYTRASVHIAKISGIAADYDYCLRLMRADAKAAYEPRARTVMRLGGTSNRSPQQLVRKSVEDMRAAWSHYSLLAPAVVGFKILRKVRQLTSRRHLCMEHD